MHLLKIYPITLKWRNENKKWQKESKANLSKYTTASERCVRLAGWLAGWLFSRLYNTRFASLCFACLLFIAHVLQLPKTKTKSKTKTKTKTVKVLLLLLFLHYDYSRKFRADLWVHESPWIGSNSQTNNKQVASNKQSIALSLV
jgi:hypothetical protein